MQGINVKNKQEWPDAPEGQPELQKLIEEERSKVHSQCDNVMHQSEGRTQ